MAEGDERGILGHPVIRQLQEDLRRSTPTPRHAQIYDALRVLIARGDLEGGAHLPPLTRFSRVLLVGEGTVRTATERLVQHGYLDPRTKHGYRVTERTPDRAPDQTAVQSSTTPGRLG